MTYLPEGVGTDFDRTAAILGPFGSDGTGEREDVCIQKGRCSKDSAFFNHEEIETIARCAVASFDRHLNATFLSTAHTEIEERWDYVKAWDLGWINKTRLDPEKEATILELRGIIDSEFDDPHHHGTDSVYEIELEEHLLEEGVDAKLDDLADA